MLVVKSTIALTVVVMVAAVVVMSGCNEQLEKHYPTAATAAQAGAFDHGWIPRVLQPDVTDIREWHDLDTNEVRGRFAPNDSVLNRLQSTCKQGGDLPRRVRSAPNWWPDSVNNGGSAKNTPVFHCDNFFITTDTQKATGYFWTNGP
jgi:hypothetical protein